MPGNRHARFWSGGGAGDCPTDHNEPHPAALLPGALHVQTCIAPAYPPPSVAPEGTRASFAPIVVQMPHLPSVLSRPLTVSVIPPLPSSFPCGKIWT